jgi:hypothetical protein
LGHIGGIIGTVEKIGIAGNLARQGLPDLPGPPLGAARGGRGRRLYCAKSKECLGSVLARNRYQPSSPPEKNTEATR